MSSYKEYKDLLAKTYNEAVEFLLQKYGPAQDDYFREKSFQKFIRNANLNMYRSARVNMYTSA